MPVSRQPRERADEEIIAFLKNEIGWNLRDDSGVGIKPISRTGSERLIRAAIRFALENKRKSLTLVHKGNIMKYTEGAFRNWGYELAKREFRDRIVTWGRRRRGAGFPRESFSSRIASPTPFSSRYSPGPRSTTSSPP